MRFLDIDSYRDVILTYLQIHVSDLLKPHLLLGYRFLRPLTIRCRPSLSICSRRAFLLEYVSRKRYHHQQLHQLEGRLQRSFYFLRLFQHLDYVASAEVVLYVRERQLEACDQLLCCARSTSVGLFRHSRNYVLTLSSSLKEKVADLVEKKLQNKCVLNIPCNFSFNFTRHLINNKSRSRHRLLQTFTHRAATQASDIGLRMCSMFGSIFLCNNTFSAVKWAQIRRFSLLARGNNITT